MARRERRNRRRLAEREPTPGELYGQIEVSREVFEPGAGALVKPKLSRFIRFCKSINRRFPGFGKDAKFSPKHKAAVEFLDWDLKPAEFAAASKFVMFISVLAAVALGLVLMYSPVAELIVEFTGMPFMTPLYLFGPGIIVAIALTFYVQNFPITAAKVEQTRALTYVPEIMGYMIMSIKLVPNLEKAVEFAAEHGRGRIADAFKILVWDVQLGVYTTLSEGLDALAYRWGAFSDEFKHALMRIRASVIENTEAKRYALLDKTMTEILESIREKMEQYARNLSQPTIVLFYVGVLLPLILIIILPVGSAFSGTAMANPLIMVAVYNILIPLVTILFAVNLVKRRPPTYEPPDIKDDFPELPPKWKMGKKGMDLRFVVVVVVVIGLFGAWLYSTQGFPPRVFMEEESRQLQVLPWDQTELEVLTRDLDKGPGFFDLDGVRHQQLVQITGDEEEAVLALLTEKQLYFMEPENDITPYNFIFVAMITFGIAAFVFLHYSNKYKRKIQLDVVEMESEFKDSIYVLASRMGENKPVEEALKHTREFLPNLKISQRVFGRTLDNIQLLGMPLESALFDPNYGSLKNMPSAMITSSMKILVDSVKLGVNVGARSLMSLSMQLSNSEKVNKMLKVLVSDITGMMRTISVFIAPIVLGITTVLQRIVTLTISGIAASGFFQRQADLSQLGSSALGSSFSGVRLQSLVSPEVIGGMATPAQFVIIVAIYIIELVVIMNYFTTKIEEDNNILVKMNLAKALPLSITVFIIAMIASNFLVGGFLG